MEMVNVNSIKTKEEARQKAIDWQREQSNQSMSWVESAYWGDFFTQIGKKFGLLREYRENGIC